jgi:teichuronic acid biosynthesis glycosyltransferase TuaG
MVQKNNFPIISVIVTTFNRKNMLKTTIKSILSQSFTQFELLIIDNFSDYDFLNFVNSFNDSRIRSFQNKNKGIIAVNRNFGLKRSKGKYIAFCDDDDYWNEDKLLCQIKAFQNSNTILVSSLALNFGTNTGFFSKNYGFLYNKIKLDYKSLLIFNPIILSSTLIKSKVLKKVGGFSEDANLIAVEDYDLYLRIFELGNFILIKKFLIFYRFHLGSVSKSGIDDKLRRQKLFKIRGIKNIHTDKKWIKRKHLKNNIVFIFFNNLIQFFLINKIKIFGYISTALDLDSLIYVDNSKK